MTKGPDKKGASDQTTPETPTRRMALKRMAAAAIAGGAAGSGLIASAKEAWAQYTSGRLAQRYISAPGTYVNTVYVSGYSNYSRHISYYTSYRSHYSSVPPPYIPPKR